MYWNLRFVRGTTEGVTYIRLQEVYYNDDDDSLLGYSDPYLYGESAEFPKELASRVVGAALKPVLDEADFPIGVVG